MPEYKIINNDSLIELKNYPDNHFDSVVTDPPWAIAFMHQKWDYNLPSVEFWKEVFRVLKFGGHILVCCGTRTQHRMVVNIEDAGFEIKDIVSHVYASGFPKGLDISKAIDNHLGAERKIIGKRTHPTLKDKSKVDRQDKSQFHGVNTITDEWDISEPATDEAKRWNGFKTQLKPSHELWTLARKPIKWTIAENILKYGVGGLNIDGCRIPTSDNTSRMGGKDIGMWVDKKQIQSEVHVNGRYPSNIIFDDFTGAILDKQSGTLTSGSVNPSGFKGEYGAKVFGKYNEAQIDPKTVYADTGGASRFFYCAKASTHEKNKGLEGLNFSKDIGHNRFDKCKKCGGTILQNADRPSACACEFPERENNIVNGNFHPTAKPVKLLQFLTRLITPPNGICLDPFNGSGTTGIACKLEGFNYVGIEKEKEYCEISKARIDGWVEEVEYEKQINAKEDKSNDDQLSFF